MNDLPSSPQLDLEALVAHVYVVGGRAIGSAPPGALSMVAPSKAPPQRQEETFFVLLVSINNTRTLARDYQAMATLAGEAYFKTSGGIPGGLRESLTVLNDYVLQQQKASGQLMRVGALYAVMRERELYVARTGPMLAFFRMGATGRVVSFPANHTPENLSQSPALGEASEPRVELIRYDLSPSAILVLADSNFAQTGDEEWRSALLLSADIGAALEPVRDLLKGASGHASLIQFVTEDTPTPELPARSRMPLPSALPPVVAPPKPPVLTVPAAQTPPDSASSRSSRRTRQIVARTLTGVAESTRRASETIFHEEPEPPVESRVPVLTNLAILMALVIPLVIVVVVVGLALSQDADTAFEICRMEVLARADAARQLNPPLGAPLNDEKANQAREQWKLLFEESQACERKKPGDEEMRRLGGEAQNELDRFDLVRRQDVTALRRFEPEADLRGPISGNWITLYTLDRNTDAVYQDTLSTDGKVLAAIGDVPVIFKGQNVRGTYLSDLVDVHWLQRGGLPAGATNVPIVIDENGLLIWYNETFNDIDAIQLVKPPTWVSPTAMAMWQVNLYVLDAQGRQIWRYVPYEGVYSEIPEEYFFGEARPDLTTAIDLGIDEDGSIYILFQNGTVQKYRGGAEQPFQLFNLPQGALTTGNSLFVDNNPISRGLVITDPNSATLYMTTLGGTVSVGYRPLNQLNAFDKLSGALVNADTGNIYVLSGEFLYRLPRQ